MSALGFHSLIWKFLMDSIQILYTHVSGVSCLGLLMSKFHQFLTAESASHTPIFSFQDNILSKCKGIFTRLGMCIDIIESWFRIANG